LKRVSTGVNGLDEMLGGGIPEGRSILVCGGPGSGKTIFGIQYLYDGITQHKENGLFVSLDESETHIKEDMAEFGWSLGKLEKKKQLALVDASPIRTVPGKVKVGKTWIGKRDFSMLSLLEAIKRKSRETKAKRIVVDPITTLMIQYPDLSERRNALIDLLEVITNLGTTNLITTELKATTLERVVRAEEFLSHGVIIFHVFHENREFVRGIHIEKMRGIAHDQQMRPYRISDKGIIVYPRESPLTIPARLTTGTQTTQYQL